MDARVAVAHLLCKSEELVLGGGLSVSIERDWIYIYWMQKFRPDNGQKILDY